MKLTETQKTKLLQAAKLLWDARVAAERILDEIEEPEVDDHLVINNAFSGVEASITNFYTVAVESQL